jgi:predicted acetyltransferase
MGRVDFEKTKKKWIKILTEDSDVLVCEASDGRIVGFVKGHPVVGKEYDSEISAIFVLDKYQNSGLGKTLFFRGLKELQRSKCKSTIVWCNKDNPSVYFYETIGGEIFDTKIDRVGNRDYVILGFKWPHIDKIIDEFCVEELNEE